MKRLLCRTLFLAVCAGVVLAAPAGARPQYGPIGPTLSCSAFVVTGGETVSCSGTGFGTTETVTLTFASTPQVVGILSSDPSGNFTGNVTIPNDAPGIHTLTATGNRTGVSASTTFRIVAGTTTQQNATGPLAFTGTSSNTWWLAGLGALAISGGGLLVLANRKRAQRI
jgi:LPXTG-motif cell wall-anchored protein